MTLLFLILWAEYLFIIAIGFATCLIKIILRIKEKRDAFTIEQLKKQIKQEIASSTPINEVLTGKQPSLPLLLYVLEAFDILIKDDYWDRLKAALTENYLLPWARKNSKSFFWEKRNQAARIFLLHPLQSDLPFLKTLLNDKDFFIRMLAIDAFQKIPSPEAIEMLLLNMSKEMPAARFPYRHSILNMPLEAQLIVIDIYKKTEEQNLRLACLDLMSRRILGNPLPLIKKDYSSTNLALRTFIVRILGNLASEEAVSDLLRFLEDSAPEVRKEALISLAKLRSEKSFEKVAAMLHDPDNQVRLQAAFTLLNMGKPGIQLLETQDWDLNPQAYEAARYVLTMP